MGVRIGVIPASSITILNRSEYLLSPSWIRNRQSFSKPRAASAAFPMNQSVGFSVIPATCTHLVFRSMKNRT